MALILLVIALSVTVLSCVFTAVYFLNRAGQRADAARARSTQSRQEPLS